MSADELITITSGLRDSPSLNVQLNTETLPWTPAIRMKLLTNDLKLIVDRQTTVALKSTRDRKKKSDCKASDDLD